METSNQINLTFHGIDFINVKFNSIQPFRFEEKINFKIDAKLNIDNDSENNFQIIMGLEMQANSYFELNIVAVGYFEIKSDASKELRANFINVNAPAIMFPYVRSFVSTLTSNFGNCISTLIIPPQFFKGEVKNVTKKNEL